MAGVESLEIIGGLFIKYAFIKKTWRINLKPRWQRAQATRTNSLFYWHLSHVLYLQIHQMKILEERVQFYQDSGTSTNTIRGSCEEGSKYLLLWGITVSSCRIRISHSWLLKECAVNKADISAWWNSWSPEPMSIPLGDWYRNGGSGRDRLNRKYCGWKQRWWSKLSKTIHSI